jgi:hypothetical protein
MVTEMVIAFSRKHHQYCKDAGKWQEKTPRVNIVLREWGKFGEVITFGAVAAEARGPELDEHLNATMVSVACTSPNSFTVHSNVWLLSLTHGRNYLVSSVNSYRDAPSEKIRRYAVATVLLLRIEAGIWKFGISELSIIW